MPILMHSPFHEKMKEGANSSCAHGDIKKRGGKQGREGQPPLHSVVLRLCRAGLRLCFFAAPGGDFRNRAVPGVFHSGHDRGRIQGTLVIRDHHAVLQQIYGHLRNTGQLRHALFYSGRAGGSGHTGNIKLFLAHIHPFFLSCEVLPF